MTAKIHKVSFEYMPKNLISDTSIFPCEGFGRLCLHSGYFRKYGARIDMIESIKTFTEPKTMYFNLN